MIVPYDCRCLVSTPPVNNLQVPQGQLPGRRGAEEKEERRSAELQTGILDRITKQTRTLTLTLTCSYMYMCTCVHGRARRCTRTRTTHVHVHAHVCMHACMHTCTHACMHTCMHTCVCSDAPAHMRTRAYAQART